MSTRKASQKTDSNQGYKKLLLEAKALRGQAGGAAYDRAKLLNAVFEDTEFLADLGSIDQDKAAKVLDDYVQDLALSFLELRALFLHFPKRAAWEDGKLRDMYDEMLDARPQPEKRTASRKTATVAELTAAREEIARLNRKLKAAQEQLAQLKEENKELKKELRGLVAA